MKTTFLTLIAASLAITAVAQKKPANPAKAAPKKQTVPINIKKPTFTGGLDSASYAFGFIMATNLKSNGLTTLNYDVMVKGLKDAFTDQKALLTDEQSENAISTIFKEAGKIKNAAIIAEGKAFFEKNKNVPGVITTVSGLQYQVLKAGSGEKPGPDAKVKVHYRGTLLNGKQFDSSYDRGQPTPLSVDQVIPGWTEGLQLMQKGAKFKFFIPYQLAYGERAAGPEIPAYSDLIFEIELLEIEAN